MTNLHNSPEIWKDIPGYEGEYQVSDLGRFKSLEKQLPTVLHGEKLFRTLPETLLKNSIVDSGYIHISLYKNRKPKAFRAHRLVAFVFVEGYFEGAQVNHINGIKTDNRAVNLEWCNSSHNNKHAFDSGLYKTPMARNTKKVLHIPTNRILDSIMEVARETNIKDQTVRAHLNGKVKPVNTAIFRKNRDVLKDYKLL